MAIMLNSRSNVYENIFSSASQPPDSSTLLQPAGIAVLAPGLCPDAACSETVGVAPESRAPTSSSMDVSVQGLAEAPVLNCIATLCKAQ